MIIADHQQDASQRTGAGRIGVAQRVRRTIESWRFAVPEAEHAVVASAGEQARLLTAPHGRGGQVLVDAWLKDDAIGVQRLGVPPQLSVETAERRTAIAGDETGGVAPGAGIQSTLIQRQAGDGLDAG